MWDAHTPIADCFRTSVKPSARALLASYKQQRRQTDSSDTDEGKPKKKDEDSFQNGKQEDSSSWVSSQREYQFPETIPEEASSLEEERVVIFRLPGPASAAPPSLYKVVCVSASSIVFKRFFSGRCESFENRNNR